MELIKFPFIFIKFWYLEAPSNILRFFASLNKAFFGVFSLPLMLKTFFRPWKNEYREGLVGFSIIMGIIIKSLFIFADLILFILLILAEVIMFLIFLIMPIAAFILPLIKL
ncbi:MAG: hypothetical protein ABSD69_01060 [Candidatus Levyibacteriota bacterium]|jgi:hypothetical protein